MMGMTVADLVAKLGLDSSEFDRGMDGVAGKAGRAGKVLGGVSKAAMAGAVAAGALVVKSLDTYNNFGTAINTLTRLTGMSSQAASKLTGQWQRFGVESQSGINATKFLARNLDTAQQAALKTKAEIDGLDKGSKTYGDQLSKLQVKLIGNEGAFARLGVSIFDAHGKLRSVDTILPQVRDKLSKMEDPGRRAALALKLFGRGGADLLGWITKTPGEIKAVNKELQGLGMVWGGKQIGDWKALKDAQREMGLQWTALQINLAQTLLPALKTLMGYVQDGIKWWNGLSDGAQHFIEVATGVVGVLGLIAPKTIAAAAAIKTMFAAQAAGGAASAAGSAGGGLASGVAANVASAAGVGGTAKGYQALTASKMFGGAGVTPAAAIAGTVTGTAWGAAFSVAAIAATGIILAEIVRRNASPPPAGVRDMSAAGVVNQGRMAGSAPASAGANQAKIAAAEAAKAAATIDAAMSKLGAKAATATGPAFERIRKEMTSIQTLANEGFEFGDLKAKHTDGQLRSLRDRIQGQLHITQKAADRIMASMFKDWRPQDTVKPKINAAMAAAEARMAKMRAIAARQTQFGGANTAGLANSISNITGAFNSMAGAARTAGDAAINALSVGGGGGSYRGHFMAAGGIVSGRTLATIGESGPEAVIPLTNPRRAAQVMGEAGLLGGGGTTNRIAVNVNAPVTGVDDLYSVVYAGTMAAMEEAQVAEGRSARGSVR